MNDNIENKETDIEQEEFSTIFSDPTAHKEVKKGDNDKKRIKIIISSVLAVAILVASSLAVIKLIPVLKDNAPKMPFEDISVIKEKEETVKEVNVTNKNGSFKFLSEKAETTDNEGKKTTEIIWYLPDVSRDVISSDSISNVVASAIDITATRTISSKTAAECGLESPQIKVDVVTEEKGEYSVLVGDTSPDNSGIYLKLSNDEKIYIVNESEVSDYTFELLDLADKSSFTATEFEGDVTGYYEDNTITFFDSLTFSGKNFPSEAVINIEKDERFSLYTDYVLTSPVKRYAANLENILAVYTEGLPSSGAYSLDVSNESLEKFGLNNPDLVITLNIKGQLKTFKFAKVDDGYSAVINEQSKIIRKVANENIPFIDYTVESLYTSWISMQKMDDIKNLTVISSDAKSYDIVTYRDENSQRSTYDITLGGKKINSDKFKDFFTQFITLNALDYTVVNTSATPDLTVKMTFSADNLVKSVSFTKVSETKYQYSIDGAPQGAITASDYNNLVKSINSIK